MAELTDRLRELEQIDFSKGTLVEYKDGFGFDAEWGRARITKVQRKGKELFVRTKGEALLELYDVAYIREIRREGNVFYLDIPILFNYALAPKGVDIPRKPTLSELGGK